MENPESPLFHAHRAHRRAVALGHSGRFVLSVFAASAIAACGADTAMPAANAPAPNAVTIQATPAIQFTPASATLAVGGTATISFGSVPHNLYFDNAPAGAPANIAAPTSNQSVALTFNTAGTFEYNCYIHPGMKGSIVVK